MMQHFVVTVVCALLSFQLCTSNGAVGDISQKLIQLGRKDMKEHKREGPPRSGVLCAVFAPTDALTFDTILKNANVVPCAWAIVFYNISDTGLRDQMCGHESIRSKVVYCQSSSVTYDDVTNMISHHLSKNKTSELHRNSIVRYHKFIPKQVMYMDIIPLLKNYERVLLLDADISFINFNFGYSLEIWDCAFENAPLIVQPLINGENTFHAFRLSSWEGSNLLARSSQLIEIQTPFFNAEFFEWLSRRLLKAVLKFHIIYGTDWGIDFTWCEAARAYGKHILNIENYATPCALLFGAGSPIHLDTRTIKKTNDFFVGGDHLKDIYRVLFPTWFDDYNYWYYEGKKNSSYDAIYTHVEVSKLDSECVAKRRVKYNY